MDLFATITPQEQKTRAVAALRFLRQFAPAQELAVLRQNCQETCEEHEYFRELVTSLAERIKAMPKTYDQDGLGNKAIVHLHYFTGGCDWHITEKDIDTDGEGQHQAFGLANIGYGAELGYISIQEIIDHRGELDLHWQPQTVAKVKGEDEPEEQCPTCNAPVNGPVPNYCREHDGDYSSWLVLNNID